jgi:hypothetical protein
VVFADPTAYVVGSTVSPDFPGQPVGPHRGSDVFVYFPPTQSTTIIGGSGDDIVTCVSGSPGLSPALIIGGYTNSRDFPQKWNVQGGLSPQTGYGGGDWDGFVIEFASYSRDPILSTYLGGSGDDRVLSVDGGYGFWGVAGSTTSADFPLANPWQFTLSGGIDGFVALVNVFGAPGSSLILSSSSDWALPGAPWTGSRQGPSDGW